MQSSRDLENTFVRSWQLLTANPILIVPGIVIAIVAGIVVFGLVSLGFASAVGFGTVGMGAAGIGAAMIGAALIGIVALLAIILTIAYTTGMAGAAWETGTATLAEGSAAFRYDAGAIITAIVLLFLLVIVAAVLAPFTFFLSLLAFWIFFLYTFASVIIGKRSGTEAIAESARLALRNFGTTLLLVILLCIAFMIASWIGRELHVIPVIGSIVGFIIQQIVAVYAALVVVGEYRKLRARGEITPQPGVPMPPAAP